MGPPFFDIRQLPTLLFCWVVSFGIRHLPVGVSGLSPPGSFCLGVSRASPQFAMVALPRCSPALAPLLFSLDLLLPPSPGADWGSPPVRRFQTGHWPVCLPSAPLLTHRRRSESAPSSRNHRFRHLIKEGCREKGIKASLLPTTEQPLFEG